MNPKVSVVVPCYNGTKFIDNFIKYVHELDYDNIQLIITDDGSTDDSYKKLIDYTDTVKAKGIEYIVLHKENGGQPSAFNTGIQKADGKYVVWPDVDDRMHPDFLSIKVKYMEEHSDVDFLLSRSAIVPLGKPDKILGYTWPSYVTDNDALVDRTLRNHDCWFEPGAFMMRTSSLDRLIPGRHIYDKCGSWSGPQIQITFPFFCKGKIGYISDCLYDYSVHPNQHHVMVKDKDKLIRKNEEVKKVLVETIKSLNLSNEKQLLMLVDERTTRDGVLNAFQHNDREWFNEEYKKFSNGMITKKDKMRRLIINNRLLYFLYEKYIRVRGRKYA